MDAPSPFDASATADAILRSSDFVDFLVIKLLLCLVSPFFNDIFSSIHTVDSKHETRNRLPIVSVAEDSRTLHCMLLLIYPPYVTGCEPMLDINDLSPAARAIRKYGMDRIEGRIKEMVVTSKLLREHAFRVYALAIHLGWTEIAARAARNTLETPLSDLPFVDELHIISGADFYQYLSYRFRCEKYTGKGEEPQLAFVCQGPAANDQHSAMAIADVPIAFGPNAKADAVLRSSDGIDFYVKKSFLGHLSPVFEELFANSDSTALNIRRVSPLVFIVEDSDAALSNQRGDPPVFTIEEDNGAALISQRDDLPVFTVEEDTSALSCLLCLLHPYAGEPCIRDLKLYPKIWAAAQRFKVTFISERLEQSFLAYPSIQEEPLRSFAIGVSLGWTKAIHTCAMETLVKPLSEMKYADEVRAITGADLYRLVEYRFKCANRVGCLLDNMAKSEPAETLKTFSKYFAAVKSRLLDCPRGITTMRMVENDDLVEASRICSESTTYPTRGSKVRYLLRRRLILFAIIDVIIFEVRRPTRFC